MSGLLRRIKRSRAADAGEPPPGGEAAAPEAAPAPAEPGVGPATPAADAVPAGLDPAEAPLRPPAGRRGRLRRRLRYLRRARELMLRDLGGLLYEVHRTAGGQVESHANVIGAKVQRLTAVDAEAHAIEHALGSPRSESVVFQPGVGGTCEVCGELYGSAARFCSNCGAAVAAAADPAPAVLPASPPVAEAPASLLAPAPERTAPAGDEQPTESITAEARATGDGGAPAEVASTDEPQEPAPGAPAADKPGHPANGRDEHAPPQMSSGDPLFTRERS